MVFISNTSPITSSEDSNSKMDLDRDDMEEEIHTDTSNWTLAKRKKLQLMMEFHKEYQQIFGEKASIRTIMKRRIPHMNPLFLTLYVNRKCKVLMWMPMKSFLSI